MPGPRFRIAHQDDLGDLVELVQSAYRGDASRAGWTTEADLLDGQRIDDDMLAELLAAPHVAVLVAEEPSAPGPLACCEVSAPGADGMSHLGMFAVAPGRQGDGIGRAVLDRAEETVRERWAASGLRISVIDVRVELIEWYERRGFVRTGEHEPFPYADQRFGLPRRDDLRFAVLEKSFSPA